MTNPPHQPPSTQPPGDGVWVTPGQSFGQAYGQPGRWGPGQSVAQPDEQMVSWRPGESLPASYGPYRDGSFRSVRGLGRAASILIGVVVLVEVLFVASEWNTYRVVKDYVEGPVKDPERLDRADVISYAIAGAFVVVAVIAAVLFIVWLWRARHNADLFCAARSVGCPRTTADPSRHALAGLIGYVRAGSALGFRLEG